MSGSSNSTAIRNRGHYKGLQLIEIAGESYEIGAAHGASFISEYVFRPDGSRVILKDIVQDKAVFDSAVCDAYTAWADKEFADLPKEERYQPDFQGATDNFTFNKDALVLQYGAYEIGPYAIGLPQLVLPWDKIKGAVKAEYLP